MDFQSTIPESPSHEEGSRIMHGSPKGDIEAISWVNWGPVRMGRAGKGEKGESSGRENQNWGRLGVKVETQCNGNPQESEGDPSLVFQQWGVQNLKGPLFITRQGFQVRDFLAYLQAVQVECPLQIQVQVKVAQFLSVKILTASLFFPYHFYSI